MKHLQVQSGLVDETRWSFVLLPNMLEGTCLGLVGEEVELVWSGGDAVMM